MATSGEIRSQDREEGDGPTRFASELGTSSTIMRRVLEILRVRNYSPKTAKAYAHWIGRYLRFHANTHPRFLREAGINAFLTHLAVDQNVAASTQNQALAALLFFYEHVLGQPLDRIDGVVRARKPKHVPVVLSREEVQTILPLVEGVPAWSASFCTGRGQGSRRP